MGENSHIEWTDHTFNPWIGCTKVSPGCEHCYAEGESKRRGWATWGKGKPRQRTDTWNNPIRWNQEARERRQRLRVFCASLADVFDSEVDPQWREDLWEVVRKTPFLDWLILTKRPENIPEMLPPDWGEGWSNVCLMTSVEDQIRTNRIAKLIEIPAQFRALSVEPLLGPVKLKPEWFKRLDWIIVGGESQGGARPMNPDWVRSIQQQCTEHDVRFFFKQWGCWSPDEQFANRSLVNAAYFDADSDKPVLLKGLKATERRELYADRSGKTFVYRTGKGKAGNLLDGQRYRDHPFGQKIPKSEIAPRLTRDESRRLGVCEETIRKGLGTFVAVGMALMEIRNSRLYRQTHVTFEEYAQAVLALSRSHAYGLMDSAQVVQDLSAIADIPLPTNEAQARELRRLKTPEERLEKWRMVVAAATDQPLTAKFVREALRPSQPRKPVVEVEGANSEETIDAVKACLAKLRSLITGSLVAAEAEGLIEKLEYLIICRKEMHGT